MDRWRDKSAIVTGASSGIGAAVALDLVKAGMNVIALGRRECRLEQLKDKLPVNLRNKFHPVKCDLSDEDQVKKTFQWVDDTFGGIYVLVNNAGILRYTKLIDENNTDDIRDTVETNVMGVFFCTREAFQSMKRRNIAGHIVNVNSVAGHINPYFPTHSPNIYPATKHAVTAMTETYRQEFSKAGTNIKITSISPGVVKTEIFPEEVKLAMEASEEVCAMLNSEDVSNAILYCISTPPNVQIHELTIKPLHEKF